MNNKAIEHISTSMDTVNAQQWVIYADPHYNYRHDSVEDIMHFTNSDIGKAIAILNTAWCALYDLRESLKAQESSNGMVTV